MKTIFVNIINDEEHHREILEKIKNIVDRTAKATDNSPAEVSEPRCMDQFSASDKLMSPVNCSYRKVLEFEFGKVVFVVNPVFTNYGGNVCQWSYVERRVKDSDTSGCNLLRTYMCNFC